jgi:formylglycine-generating enzyme required for sulfatase activity
VEVAGRVWEFTDPHVGWQHQVVQEFLTGLDRLDPGPPDEGAVVQVRRRLAQAEALRAVSIDAHADAWRRTQDAVAASPRYGGLALPPQLGLVPLGPDPDSDLFEFAHVGSGAVPERDAATGRLRLDEDAAIVLVLLPPGTYRMGAQSVDPSAPSYDPVWGARLRVMQVRAFFIGKHEITQSQWSTMTGGLAPPSRFRAGTRWAGRTMTARHPVERVRWDDCVLWLGRHRLGLPSVAHWEYACRAGTDSTWFHGSDAARLGEYANVADVSLRAHVSPDFLLSADIDDGHAVTAPVGTYRPNAFGLHDMNGNVQELCADPVVGGPERSQLARGGGWAQTAKDSTSASKSVFSAEVVGASIGLRAYRPLDPP